LLFGPQPSANRRGKPPFAQTPNLSNAVRGQLHRQRGTSDAAGAVCFYRRASEKDDGVARSSRYLGGWRGPRDSSEAAGLVVAARGKKKFSMAWRFAPHRRRGLALIFSARRQPAGGTDCGESGRPLARPPVQTISAEATRAGRGGAFSFFPPRAPFRTSEAGAKAHRERAIRLRNNGRQGWPVLPSSSCDHAEVHAVLRAKRSRDRGTAA